MDKIIQSPGKYIQGADVIARIGQYASPLADKFLVLGDAFVLGLTEAILTKSFNEHNVGYAIAKFNGECSQNEINRLIELSRKEGCKGVIGIGGGKTLDTAKAMAFHMKQPVIIAPTIASTDAPCSALSVVYTDQGEFETYLLLPSNPNIVLVDTKIIAGAPARLLAAGIGDALATYFEANACKTSCAVTMAGGVSTEAALSLASLCFDTLLEEGRKAMIAVEKNVVTEAVERVVEANTYLSGIGFESGGLAAAHAIHNGLTAIPDAHHMYHGEKVAFGTLVQLILENASTKQLNKICEFCAQIGLPITLKELGITEDIEAKIRIVAESSCAEGETIHNMPFEVTADKVYAAILTADEYGRLHLAKR